MTNSEFLIEAYRLCDIMGNSYNGVQFSMYDLTGVRVLSGAMNPNSATGAVFAHGTKNTERVERAKAAFRSLISALN